MTSHDIFIPSAVVDSAAEATKINFVWIDPVVPEVVVPSWLKEHWLGCGIAMGVVIGAAKVVHMKRDFLADVVIEPAKALIRDWYNEKYAKFVDMCREQPIQDAHKQAFREMVVRKLEPIEGSAHSHDAAAADRTASNDAIDTFIDRIGGKAKSISMSHRDESAGNLGTRLYYTAKDLSVGYRDDPTPPNVVYKCVDVVCHMSYYQVSSLAKRMRPMVFYDFQPIAPCGKIPNGNYTTNAKGEVVVVVDGGGGGGGYIHEVWDFDTDCICFDYFNGTAVYMVETMQTHDSNRRIIGLFPVTFIYGPAGWFLSGRRLRRRFIALPVMRNFGFFSAPLTMICVRYNKKETCPLTGKDLSELRVAISLAGFYHCVDLPDKRMAAIIQRMASKDKPEIADVERMLRDMCKEQDAMTYAPLLHAIGISAAAYLAYPIFTATGKAPSVPHIRKPNYQTIVGLGTEDGKPTTRIIGPAFMAGNIGPMKSYNNDIAAVEGRITRAKNPTNVLPHADKGGASAPGEKTIPAVFRKFAREFNEQLIPERLVMTGVPYPIEQVLEWQARPTQMAAWEAAKATSGMHKFIVKTFQKAETYGKVAWPRIISTVNADDRVRYSCYVYAFSHAVLMPTNWYAFGKNPIEVSQAVQNMCQNTDMMFETDYSNWDGSHSQFNADNQLAAMLRFFGPQYHAEIRKLHESRQFATAVTPHGVVYNCGTAQLSGGADTALFNSYNNKGNDFIYRRVMGVEPKSAYAADGIFGGDDGATSNVDVRIYERTIKRLGHVLKGKVVPRGHPLGFLGRIYPDPWLFPYSFYDPKRCIMKMHVTTSPADVPDGLCLARKAEGLLTTDANTPFLSNWARAIARIYPQYMHISNAYDPLVKRDKSWFSQYHVDVQFPQEPDQSMTLEFMSKQLDVGVDFIKQCCEQLDNARSLTDFPADCFSHIETPVQIPGVLDGEIRHPPTPIPSLAPVPKPRTSVPAQPQRKTGPTNRTGQGPPNGSFSRGRSPPHPMPRRNLRRSNSGSLHSVISGPSTSRR